MFVLKKYRKLGLPDNGRGFDVTGSLRGFKGGTRTMSPKARRAFLGTAFVEPYFARADHTVNMAFGNALGDF